MRGLKIVRKILVPTVILIVVFLIGGAAYSLLTSQEDVPETPVKTSSASEEAPAELKPHKPAPNAPESVAIYLSTEEVKAGSNTGLTVRTNPGSTCTISVIYNGVPSRDSGLANKTADAYGVVTWTWTVESNVPAGSWPVKVTCVYNGRSGVAQANLPVVK
jgi:hypothetical protein